MKSALSFLLAIAALVGLAFYVGRTSSKSSSVTSGNPTARPDHATGTSSASSASRPVASDPVAPADPVAAPAAPTRTFAQITSELMTTPEMQRATERMLRSQIETEFGKLLGSFGLTPEQTNEIIRLLTERKTNQMSALVETSTGKLQGDELAAAQARFLEADDRLTREIEGVLGNPNLSQRVDEFGKTEPERGRVAQLGKSSTAAGEPLGEEQAAALTSALYQARKNAPFTQDFSDPLRSNPHLLLDEAVVDAYRREFQTQLNLERAAAASLLSPAQLALFDKVQERQLTVFQNDLARQLRVMR